MKLPQSMVNMAMPNKLKDWYNNLVKAVNEDMTLENIPLNE